MTVEECLLEMEEIGELRRQAKKIHDEYGNL
jgi:hypothetical protein